MQEDGTIAVDSRFWYYHGALLEAGTLQVAAMVLSKRARGVGGLLSQLTLTVHSLFTELLQGLRDRGEGGTDLSGNTSIKNSDRWGTDTVAPAAEMEPPISIDVHSSPLRPSPPPAHARGSQQQRRQQQPMQHRFASSPAGSPGHVQHDSRIAAPLVPVQQPLPPPKKN